MKYEIKNDKIIDLNRDNCSYTWTFDFLVKNHLSCLSQQYELKDSFKNCKKYMFENCPELLI